MKNTSVYVLSLYCKHEHFLIDVFSTAEDAEKGMCKHLEKYYGEILDFDIPDQNIIRYFTTYGTYVINKKQLK